MQKEEKTRILLVEDDAADQMLIQRALKGQEEKYFIHIAPTCAEALEVFSSEDFDLVIIDNMLPDGYGLDLLEEMRDEAPVLFMTSGGDETIAVTALKAGAYDYLVKDSGKGYLSLLSQLIEDVVTRFRQKQRYKKIQKSLRDSEEKFRLLADGSTDLILMVNEFDRIAFANKKVEDLLGFSQGELLQKDLSELVDGGDQNQTRSDLYLLSQEDQAIPVREFRFAKKDQTLVDLEVSVSLTKLHTREFFLVYICRDITEKKKVDRRLKEMQDHMIQSEKLGSMGVMISGIAHELNNPLQGILGLSQILAEDYKDADFKEDVIEIEKLANHCKAIVSDLLQFSCYDKTNVSVIDVNALVDRFLNLWKYKFKSDNIQLKKEFDQDTLYAPVNPVQLGQVFFNISENAVHAMAKGGDLLINTKLLENSSGRYVAISFKDTGVGIQKEELPHVFDPFFTTKEVGIGTGLGLSVCHGIIQQHKGKIEVDSGGPGTGTTVRILLPAGNESLQISGKMAVNS